MKKLLLLITIFTSLFMYTPLSVSYAANPLKGQYGACKYLNDKQKENSAACNTGGGNPIERIIKNITNVVSAVVGIAAVIMIIVGGISMMLAGGDTQKFANGRNTVLYAVIGIIVVVLAQALVRFILSRVG